MIQNYLKIALRNLKRHPGYAAINIFGLAIGIAVCAVILLYVRFETSYDEFHEHADQIYRITGSSSTSSPNPLGPTIAEELPEVQSAVRLTNWGGWELKVTRGATSHYERRVFYADSTFFDMFSFPLIHGNPESALDRPFTVVLTREMAEKYFGSENPIGQTLQIQTSSWGEHEYEVTGVAEDIPANSHLTFNFVMSFPSLVQIYPSPENFNSWRHWGPYTYILLDHPEQIASLREKFPAFVREHRSYESREEANAAFRIQALPDIHLHSDLQGEIEPGGNVNYLYIFSALALLVLGIACINYMNLATARASRREREVGVRKVIGARRPQLIRQFLGESMLFALVATLLAVGLVKLGLPVFNSLTSKALSLSLISDGGIVAAILGIGLLTGLLAGSYPAFMLSRFRPAAVLTGRFQRGIRGLLLRKGLIVFQFALSIGLIAGTILMERQLQYMQSKELGLNKEHVVNISARRGLRGSFEAFKQELLQHARIQNVSGASRPLPIAEMRGSNLLPEGVSRDSADYVVRDLVVDPNFTETLKIPVIRGRNLTEGTQSDETRAVLVNQTAVETFSWENPIGKRFDGMSPTREVVGVVEDFHYRPLELPIEPLIMMKTWYEPPQVFVRIQPDQIPSTIAYIREQWEAFGPGTPLEYSFMDEQFDQAYRSQQQLATIFGGFSGLAIFIACLGLLGLAALAAQRRTKEIGIRKVVGASVYQIVSLLSKDFLKLVGVAILIATPIAYLAAQRWLEQFAYRIEVGPETFAIAGAASVLIALLTVSYHAITAALTNPAESLRYE